MRLTPFVSIIAMAVLTFAVLPCHADDASESEQKDKVVKKHIPTDWTLLQFYGKRKIRKATIVIRVGDQPIDHKIEITDRKLLGKIESFFVSAPLSLAEPDNGQGGGGWGCGTMGKLNIETSDGNKFFIAISQAAFHLDLNYPNTTNAFWSGPLARMIDELYSAKYKTHLPNMKIALAEQHFRIALGAGGFSQEFESLRKKTTDD